MIQFPKIVLIYCLMGALIGHTGCSNPEAPLVKPEIVRKKINKNTGEIVKTEPSSVAVPDKSGASSLKPEIVLKQIDDKPEIVRKKIDSKPEIVRTQIDGKPEIVRKKIDSKSEIVRTQIDGKPEIVRKQLDDKPEIVKATPVPGIDTLPVSPLKKLPDVGVRTDPIPGVSSSGSLDPLIGQAVASTSAVGGSYNPDGKIDPFIPLLKDEPQKVLPDTKTKKEKREPTTPLERVDLSQLKLTAIIRTPSGFKAMVEEITGKGYIVSVGTYIGIHSGSVTNILKDRVIVEEEVEDALGAVSNRNTELKFQKPTGEL
jgi:type IV pilus assembly protein PilP